MKGNLTTRDIMDKLISVTKWGNEGTDRDTKIWNYLKLIFKQTQKISRKFEKESSSRTGDITDNLFQVRKLGNEQTDRHTRNPKLFEISVQTI